MTDRERDLATITECFGTDTAMGRELLAQVWRRHVLATLPDEAAAELAEMRRVAHARFRGRA